MFSSAMATRSVSQLVWMCTSAEEWTAKRAGRSDKEFDSKWDYLREAYMQDAGREGDTSITLKKQNADMTASSRGRYMDDFKPSAGFMMLRNSDTPMLMASRAGGGSGRYIHRTHQPTFHPASRSSNVGAYGPAIARLWWQPGGRTSRPKGWRNYGWRLGILGVTTLCWSMSLAIFIQFLDKPTHAARVAAGLSVPPFVPLIGINAFMPFWVASDIAQTSSLCDELMDTINDAGIRYGDTSYARIAWLESRLKQLNRGQGLGFKIAEHHGGFSGRWTFDGARDALRAQ